MEYFAIIIGAIFVNNVVLAQFLGICPFLGVSNKVNTSLGMGAAVVFVMAISSIVVYLLQYYVLVPLRIEYMQTIVFILVIAALVQMVEIILKKISPALYQALGIFLCRARRSDTARAEELQSAPVFYLCRVHCGGVRPCTGRLFGHPRTA